MYLGVGGDAQLELSGKALVQLLNQISCEDGVLVAAGRLVSSKAKDALNPKVSIVFNQAADLCVSATTNGKMGDGIGAGTNQLFHQGLCTLPGRATGAGCNGEVLGVECRET